MIGARGVAVDHTTLYRWVQRSARTGVGEADAMVPEPDQLLLAGRRNLHPGQGAMGDCQDFRVKAGFVMPA